MFLSGGEDSLLTWTGVKIPSPGLQKHDVLVKGMLAAVTNKSPLFSDLTEKVGCFPPNSAKQVLSVWLF